MASIQEQVAGLIGRSNQLAHENYKLSQTVDQPHRLAHSRRAERGHGDAGPEFRSRQRRLEQRSQRPEPPQPGAAREHTGFQGVDRRPHRLGVHRRPDIAAMLNHVKYYAEKITQTGATECLTKRANNLYRLIKNNLFLRKQESLSRWCQARSRTKLC